MFGKWWVRPRQPGPPEESGGSLAVDGTKQRVDPRAPTPEDEELLDRIAGVVLRWGMDVPAIFLLESAKPLSFIGGQFLHFLSPIVHSVADARDLDRLAVLLERRETVEELILRIERADEKPPKAGADTARPEDDT